MSSTGRPPAKHQMAITGSQIAQPSEECAANGMIGLPFRWCTTSQAVCISHAIPMNVQDSRPR